MEDCCGATSQAAHEAALSRRVKAGAVRTTTIPALLEWQRDWRNREHYDNLMGSEEENVELNPPDVEAPRQGS